jgi:hypothetical protein
MDFGSGLLIKGPNAVFAIIIVDRGLAFVLAASVAVYPGPCCGGGDATGSSALTMLAPAMERPSSSSDNGETNLDDGVTGSEIDLSCLRRREGPDSALVMTGRRSGLMTRLFGR